MRKLSLKIKIPLFLMIFSSFLYLIESFTADSQSSGSVGIVVRLINKAYPCSYPTEAMNSMPCEYKYAIPYLLFLFSIFILSGLSLGIIIFIQFIKNKKNKLKVSK